MIVFLLLIPVILILAQDDLSSCPLNLIRNSALIAHNGYCYEFVINHNFDWSHANSDCTSKGGHLVVVRSSTDNLFIMRSLRSLNFHGDIVWIGLSDQKVEGTYEWPTGEAVTYTNWGSGQPDLQATIEDCIVMKYSDGGHWHDYSCFNYIFHHNNYPWICEYKQNTPPITTQAPTTKTTAQASTTKTTTQASTTKPTAQASTTKATTQASTTKTATLTTTSKSATTATHRVTTGKCVNSPFVNCDVSNICSTSAWANYCPVTCGKCRKTLSTRKITSGTTEGWFVIGQKPTAHWFLIPTSNN